jgi:hypothetical protein
VPAASPHLITEPANLITVNLPYLAIADARARSGQRFNSQFRTEAGVCAPVDPGANHTEQVMAAHPVASHLGGRAPAQRRGQGTCGRPATGGPIGTFAHRDGEVPW